MLVWTVDYPSANSTGKLPILDIETWCEETEFGTRTSYSFYSKPMANPIVIPANSAIPDSTKLSTYRQEVGRILHFATLLFIYHGIIRQISYHGLAGGGNLAVILKDLGPRSLQKG